MSVFRKLRGRPDESEPDQIRFEIPEHETTDADVHKLLASYEAERKLRARFGVTLTSDLGLPQLKIAAGGDDGDIRRAAVAELAARISSGDAQARAILDAAVAAGGDDVRDAAEVELNSPAGLLGKLAAELVEIGRHEGYVGTPGGDYDEHWNHKRARRIGAELDDSGGMELMRQAHDKVAAEFAGTARAQELEACWGGVGSWRR